MPNIEGMNYSGGPRNLQIDYLGTNSVRLKIFFPENVASNRIADLPLGSLQIPGINHCEGTQKTVEFGASEFRSGEVRPDYSSVWIKNTPKDSGWYINVPTDELEAALRHSSAAS